MLRSVPAFSVLGLVLALFGAGLTGCAINRFEAREPWRDQAESLCLSQGLVQQTSWVSLGKEIDGPGPCGMQQPFRITRLGQGTVALKQRMTLACPALSEAEAWLADTIQPAASVYFGVAVAEINAGSYSCRGQNNQVGAKLSEHSFGNALDIMSITLTDGHVITVKGGWRGTEAEQGFLREIFYGACQRFTTVLAPGSNAFHYDHIHVDLARHDPRGMRRICKPLLKFEPLLNPDGTARANFTPSESAPEQAPIDMEQDDPYATAPSASRNSGSRYARAAAPPTAYTSAKRAPPRRAAAAPTYEDAAIGSEGDTSSEPIY